MKKYFIYLSMMLTLVVFNACSTDDLVTDEPVVETPETPETPSDPDDPENPETPDDPDIPVGDSKILITYFSWGGTTQRMAGQIAEQTGGTLFRIEPVTPYPTDYTACTEVARAEKDSDARPAIAGEVEDWDGYDTVFIGCPVWWWTAPMIINTFAESYDFEGKTVIPFCTYASTYRDETLARIVELTPNAEHLTGLGLTGSGVSNTENVTNWLRQLGFTE